LAPDQDREDWRPSLPELPDVGSGKNLEPNLFSNIPSSPSTLALPGEQSGLRSHFENRDGSVPVTPSGGYGLARAYYCAWTNSIV